MLTVSKNLYYFLVTNNLFNFQAKYFLFFVLILTIVWSSNSTPTVDEKHLDKNTEDGEILETANAIVFRPLFAYRRQQSQRRRVYIPRGNYRGYYYG